MNGFLEDCSPGIVEEKPFNSIEWIHYDLAGELVQLEFHSLSIPLNGFDTIRELTGRVSTLFSFNSIEWIPQDSVRNGVKCIRVFQFH